MTPARQKYCVQYYDKHVLRNKKSDMVDNVGLKNILHYLFYFTTKVVPLVDFHDALKDNDHKNKRSASQVLLDRIFNKALFAGY